MALRPDIPYSPVPSAVPEVQQPNDSIRVQASPQDFGGQVGGALQQAGQVGQRVDDQATDLALQHQGMINESLATDAETGYITQLGAITAKYRNNEGLAAVNALPQAQQEIAALRQQVLGSLPTGGAQRAFNMLAQRHEAYALTDAASYSVQQVKAADLASAHASVSVAANQGGSLDVAQSDQRFTENLQTIDYGLNRMMQNRGYGGAMSVSPSGAPTFDTSTPQGQQAQAVYQQMRDEAHGAAWENRIHALADDPAQGNAAVAQRVFAANREQIPAEAQARIAGYLQPKLRTMDAAGTAGSVLAQTDANYRAAVSAAVANEPLIARPTAQQIGSAIHMQESGGAATSPTSVDGAVGGWQIRPATFAQYARPGEVIGSAADNQVVGRRIVADYAQRFGNDPARVAVAYFSGPGNVAPAGSPTPWVNDAKDGNGKATSAYVSEVLGRMGGVGGTPTKADYYRQNYANIIDATRNAAMAAHPDDPQAAELAVSRTEQQLHAVIQQQELSYKADNDMVWQAANGDLAKGTRPMTVDQLTATSPEVKAAWDRMQSQQPQVAREVANRILTENAKNNGTDARTLGEGFSSVFNRIHAPDGDPSKITDATQLYGMVGQPQGLTMEGLAKARAEIAGKSTPDGEAESHMRAEFFKNAHSALTGSNDGMGIKDPKGEEIYLRFMAHAYQAIDAAKAAGKTPAQIYSPDSPDYVGKALAPGAGFKRSLQQQTADMLGANTPEAARDTGADMSSRDGIISAYRSGKLSREDASRALIAGGYATATSAPAPAEKPIVPVTSAY